MGSTTTGKPNAQVGSSVNILMSASTTAPPSSASILMSASTKALQHRLPSLRASSVAPLPWAPSSSSPSSLCCGTLGRRLPHRPSKIVDSWAPSSSSPLQDRALKSPDHPLEPRHEQLFSGVGIFSYFREIRDRTFSLFWRQVNPGAPILTSLGPNPGSPTPALARSSHLLLPSCSGLVTATPVAKGAVSPA